MEPDTKQPADNPDESTSTQPQAPVDALSRTPDDLEEEQASQPTTDSSTAGEKKPSPIKTFLRKANVYVLLFVILVIIAGIVAAVTYLNSQKVEPEPEIASQQLTQDALKQLANTDASIGDASQTLTIQGNAVIAGQTLMRGNLNVAGNFQTGGSIQGPSLTISGESNLGTTQANSLQVAQNAAVQGNTSLRDLSVSGTSSFSGAMSVSQITTSTLILSGNATLRIPNHISFTGPTPTRSVNSGVLGSGGSVSLSGSDTTGTVNISTGNNPAAGCFTRVTFSQAFSNQPHVLISPVGNGAGRTQYYVDRDRSGFSICAASPAPANQTFAFDYFITN